ncbi:DUF1028 domain-containing protein [Methylobacterium oryzae CBMB20]
MGGLCPYIRAGIGAVTTQSWVNPYLAAHILDGLAGGQDPEAALAAALATDDRPDLRQLGLVAARGAGAAWTGAGCTEAAGHRTGAGYAVQGNMLAGTGVIDAMAQAFEDSAAQDLDERLMRALEAGDAAGGDRRGKQSAALKIVAGEDYPAPRPAGRRARAARRRAAPRPGGRPPAARPLRGRHAPEGRAGRRPAGRRHGDAPESPRRAAGQGARREPRRSP